MKLQLIRSATLRMRYGQHDLLIDPYLAPKHSRPSFAGKSMNPLVDLPSAPSEVIRDIEAVLVSHMHSDHFDHAAQELLPKDMPILCQPGDDAKIVSKGFREVTTVYDHFNWQGIMITRIPCQHGSGVVLGQMGPASGFIFQSAEEPTVYWAGDTVWNDALADIIARLEPRIIITHSCGAVWGESMLIVMDAAQTVEVCRNAPHAIVLATHMDSVDHATVSRKDLRHYATAHGISPEQLLIPLDGETLVFESTGQGNRSKSWRENEQIRKVGALPLWMGVSGVLAFNLFCRG